MEGGGDEGGSDEVSRVALDGAHDPAGLPSTLFLFTVPHFLNSVKENQITGEETETPKR